MVTRLFPRFQLIGIATMVMVGVAAHVMAEDQPQATVLAKRGKLILDDDGSKDRGGKMVTQFDNGYELKTALGIWNRAPVDPNVWRSTFKEGMGHPPVASYKKLNFDNVIVEVTFRWGEMTEDWQERFLRIAADQRPERKGHIVSAWANTKGRYTKTGLVLEHVMVSNGLVMDEQPIDVQVDTWQTAVLEIVGDEALFRFNDQVAYAQAPEIALGPKNTVSLTLGTTWHEIKRVRIWHAEANPEWAANKAAILKSRKPFTTRPR